MTYQQLMIGAGLLIIAGCTSTEPASTPASSSVIPIKPMASRVRPEPVVVHPIPTPKQIIKPSPKPPSRPTKQHANPIHWRYDAHACTQAIHHTMKGQIKDYNFSYLSEDETLMPFEQALKSPPRTQLGAFATEGGDGCHTYETGVTYLFRRSTSPKFTKHFIGYHKRPDWALKGFQSTFIRADVWPKAAKITALYRGPVIVYEVNYGSASRQLLNAMRATVLGCFSRRR